MEKEMTLKTLIEELNRTEGSLDLYDDVDESLACAYVGESGMVFTEEGAKVFAPALECNVTVHEDCGIVHIPDGDNYEDILENVKQLIYGLAGYCSEKKDELWFIHPEI